MFAVSGPAQAASQTREGVSVMTGRTAEACLLDARGTAIETGLMDVAVTDLRYDAAAVKRLMPSLVGDRAVVKFSSRSSKTSGVNCSIIVKMSVDETELNRRIKAWLNKPQGEACNPEIGVVVKALYEPLNGEMKEASKYGFGATEANHAMEQAFSAQGVKMVSLNPVLLPFINGEVSADTTLEGTGRRKGEAGEPERDVRENVEYFLKLNPELRRPGLVVVTAHVNLAEHGRNDYDEYEVEASASVTAVTVSLNRSSEFASMFPKLGSAATPPGIATGQSYKIAARKAMSLATESAARTISSQFLKDIRRKAASSEAFRLVLTNVTSQREQVRKVMEAFSNVGMCQVNQLEAAGNQRVIGAKMPAEDADRLVNVALDLLETNPRFSDVDYSQNGRTFTIKLP